MKYKTESLNNIRVRGLTKYILIIHSIYCVTCKMWSTIEDQTEAPGQSRPEPGVGQLPYYWDLIGLLV